jgi:hypothetical protein
MRFRPNFLGLQMYEYFLKIQVLEQLKFQLGRFFFLCPVFYLFLRTQKLFHIARLPSGREAENPTTLYTFVPWIT